jgi:hypothetical protein
MAANGTRSPQLKFVERDNRRIARQAEAGSSRMLLLQEA